MFKGGAEGNLLFAMRLGKGRVSCTRLCIGTLGLCLTVRNGRKVARHGGRLWHNRLSHSTVRTLDSAQS